MKQYGKTMLCLLVLLACMLPLRAQFVLSQKVVDDTAEKIIANLKKVQARDGSFSYDSHYRVGTTALVVYAMASAGRTESDPAAERFFRNLLRHTASPGPEPFRDIVCAGDDAEQLLRRLNIPFERTDRPDPGKHLPLRPHSAWCTPLPPWSCSRHSPSPS